MRCALLQPAMHWTPAGNLHELLDALPRAAAAGARLLVGPELGLSGFHRRVPESFAPQALDAALAELQQACAASCIALAVGLPWRMPDGRVFNSHLYLDERGEIAGRVDKRGLTPSEATVFAPGGVRGWTPLAGAAVSSVLCRETLDGERLLPEWRQVLPAAPRLLLWPSFIGASDAEQARLTRAYRAGAAQLAAGLGAWVLQSNWPQSLNDEAARGLGASMVLAPDGRCVAELAPDEPGLWGLALGEAGAEITRLA